MQDARTRLEAILRERIAVLDGSWGVLIQREVKGEEAYRGERFKDHPRDVAGDPDLLNLTRPEVVLGHSPRLLRRRRRHRHDEHIHRHHDRPGGLRARGSRVRDERGRRQAGATGGRRGRRLRRRFRRPAERHALAVAARRRPGVPHAHVRPGVRDLRGSDSGPCGRRRRLSADRDHLRHPERESSHRRSARRRARAPALDLVHGHRPQRPQPLRTDRRRVLALGRARQAVHRRGQLLARRDADAAVRGRPRARRSDVGGMPPECGPSERDGHA